MYRAHGVSPLPPRPPPPPLPPPRFTTRGSSLYTRLKIKWFLEAGWPAEAVAEHAGVSIKTVYRVTANLKIHGSIRAPTQRPLGATPAISEEDGEALFGALVRTGWMYQDEIVRWLHIERGVVVSQSTVSRYLKKKGWTRRTLRPFSIERNEELRELYRQSMRQFAADDLVFIDEAIFNEKSGWRHHAYAPVGHIARYTQNIRRGDTFAILPAYTIHGYLPCTGIKRGYYNHEDFIEWLRDRLIPGIQEMYGPRPMVVVLDNVSIHTNAVVEQVLQAAGHIVRYLPPYSPDFNPIELTFSVLKSWIRRNYYYLRSMFNSTNFGGFLEMAIQESRCDRFARKHFRYAAGSLYLEQGELDRIHEGLRHQVEWEDSD